ncbi:hypothetical protein BBP40_003863 [Aspergillus hancockii]|nr:hypothetical protein BBP40_003863 [Aspergillus hancockii]
MANLAGIDANPAEKNRCWYLNKIPETRVGYVDDISGYSPELIPLLARLGQLADRQELPVAVEHGVQITLPQELLEEAQGLEASIMCLTERTVSDATLENHGSGLASDLQNTHRAFIHATLLHLHRRVLLLPRDHIQVMEDIVNIINAVQLIDPFSPANILILWPMFSAGCETNHASERNLIQDRMSNMQSLGMGNYTRARDLMRKFWMCDSSLPWDVYYARLGLHLVLF